MNASGHAQVPAGIAMYMAVVQFLFVTTWTIYVIFLPKLLQGAGLPATAAPLILLADQLVFMAMDIYVGVAADRAQRTLGKVGPLIVGMTVVSCLAFLMLPFAADSRTAAPAAVLGLTLVWTITSSALRAPPWVLLSKYAAAPSVPRMNMLVLWGLAAGAAVAPYLGVALKNADPRMPFVLSSLTLLAATAGIVHVERRLSCSAQTGHPSPAPAADAAGRSPLYLLGLLLLAAGFQIHYSVNTSAQFLRFTRPDGLEWLMPVFWIGFGIAMFPGSALCQRYSTLKVMAVSAVLGALGAFAAAASGSLEQLIAAQGVAGGAWGTMLLCAFTAATAAGRIGREGFTLGLMFAVLAAATLGRIATVFSGAPAQPAMAAVFSWMPAVCWLAGAVLIGALAVARRGGNRDSMPPAA